MPKDFTHKFDIVLTDHATIPSHTSIRYNSQVRVEKVGINFSRSALGHNE